MLAFVHADLEIHQLPTDVLVCDVAELPALLKNRQPVLSPVTIGALHATARRPGTWRP
jgi:hypothetical protein